MGAGQALTELRCGGSGRRDGLRTVQVEVGRANVQDTGHGHATVGLRLAQPL
jgi:hypothetical protein